MNLLTCYYCLERGHCGRDCPIFSTSGLNDSESNLKKYSITLINRLIWQVCQERNCISKIKRIFELAEFNNIKIDLTNNRNLVFRCACYNDDVEFAEFLLKKEPKINVRDSNDSAFINASWEYYLVRTHKNIILLLLRECPYVYSYSFERHEHIINTLKEERDARWKVKREAIMVSSHLKKNDTMLYRLPSELSRIVIEFLYKK
jgi:hypothetical protein